MVFGWFSKKKQDDRTIKHKVASRKEASDEYVKYGEDMANSNNLEKAIECFDKAIGINPKNDFAWGDRGLILDKQGKTEEALASFSKAIEIDPKNAITWHNKGLSLIRSNRVKEAIECFDTAIECRENYAKAWYNKGRALSMLGELKRSQDCFDKARKLDPLLYTKLKKIR
ncbi:MAG TPA: tetratricopeptide repeat protein [Candidatus Nitrosopolaris sp.]|nr:tetratricopeptide repeat protein [Candidatus Nitrosopolaris sp.]